MESKFIIRPFRFNIEFFRNFKDVSFDLGKKFTVISGQNGVGKSNILSLIASGSGINKKSVLGSNFQPEFYDFFNIDQTEDFENYKLFLRYSDSNENIALTKKLSFKDDTADGRGIRVIPRTIKYYDDDNKLTLRQTEQLAKEKYGVGGAARVGIPTIFLSLSRLYPLGERRDSVVVKGISKRNLLYQKRVDEKFKQWYNCVIPNAIKNDAVLTRIEKNACSRASFHMDMENTPTLSQSIGQDNVGNIISALVDIYILSLEEDYKGALLCIDEVDVSLHPDTQIRLLDLFDRLADELSVQFVISTHSLTVLKESIKREQKNEMDYKVVYIKDPIAPYITESKSYDLLKADLLGSLSFSKPKVKVYFEDKESKELFGLLIGSFRKIYKAIENDLEGAVLRNSAEVKDYAGINDKIKALGNMINIVDNVNTIATGLGCDDLMRISNADSYFKRVIIILDGDARLKEPSQKPKIRSYVGGKFEPKRLNLNDRSHGVNICFFPDYFAPESYLYAIIYKIYSNASEHMSFWRTLDQNEETALYTADKIRQLFSGLTGDYTNDDVKNVFSSEVWDFVRKSDIITYYFSDYRNVRELISFVTSLKKAYDIAYPLTLSNRYA